MRLSLYEFHTGAETLGGHRVVYDVANDTAVYGEAHVEGHALVWHLTTRRRKQTAPGSRGGSSSTRSPTGSFAATESTFRRAGSPTRTRIPGRGSATCSRGRSTSTPRVTPPPTGRVVPGSSPAPIRCRRSVAAPADRVRSRPDPAGRVGRETDDPLRRSGGRGSAEAPEAHRLPRAPARSDVRTGGRLLVDQLVVHGVDVAFGVPGESYLAVLDALYDAPIGSSPAVTRSAQRTWPMPTASSQVGRASAWSRAGPMRHTPPGASTPPSRTPLRDPPDRPGRPRDDGTGGIPGDRLPAHVRADGEVGRADRRSRPDSGARLARFPRRHLRPPGAGRARAPGGHARRGIRPSRTRSRARSSASIRIPATSNGPESSSQRRSGRSSSSAAPHGAPRRTGLSRPGALRARSRSPPAGGARTTSTTARTPTSATSPSAPTPGSHSACATRMSCW